MLEARFEDGTPIVALLVVLPPSSGGASPTRTLSVSLDFGLKQTTLTRSDLGLVPIPLDDLLPTPAGRLTPVLLTFTDLDAGPVTYLRLIRETNGAPGDSRVGQDILRHWTTVIDFADGTIVLQPASWDLREPLK